MKCIWKFKPLKDFFFFFFPKLDLEFFALNISWLWLLFYRCVLFHGDHRAGGGLPHRWRIPQAIHGPLLRGHLEVRFPHAIHGPATKKNLWQFTHSCYSQGIFPPSTTPYCRKTLPDLFYWPFVKRIFNYNFRDASHTLQHHILSMKIPVTWPKFKLISQTNQSHTQSITNRWEWWISQ